MLKLFQYTDCSYIYLTLIQGWMECLVNSHPPSALQLRKFPSKLLPHSISGGQIFKIFLEGMLPEQEHGLHVECALPQWHI